MKRKLLSLLAAVALLFGTLAVTSAPANAIEVHAWNTSPNQPVRWYGLPLGFTSYSSGPGSNATLWKTCLLKWRPSTSSYTNDGCDADTYDFDHTGTSQCLWNSQLQQYDGWFITQSWVNIHHSPYYTETVVLYSPVAVVRCNH